MQYICQQCNGLCISPEQLLFTGPRWKYYHEDDGTRTQHFKTLNIMEHAIDAALRTTANGKNYSLKDRGTGKGKDEEWRDNMQKVNGHIECKFDLKTARDMLDNMLLYEYETFCFPNEEGNCVRNLSDVFDTDNLRVVYEPLGENQRVCIVMRLKDDMTLKTVSFVLVGGERDCHFYVFVNHEDNEDRYYDNSYDVIKLSQLKEWTKQRQGRNFCKR